jgi:hypothetical protein
MSQLESPAEPVVSIFVITTVAVWGIVSMLFVATRGQLGHETGAEAATTQTSGHRSEVQ